MKTCRTCKHADWQRGPSGRVRPSEYGYCRYVIELPALPRCVDRRFVSIDKRSIRYDDGRECETWEAKG